MMAFVLWFFALLAGELYCQEDEYGESIYVFRFQGRSEAIYHYLQQQPIKARFHGIFLIPSPRSYVFGEALVQVLAEQLKQNKFEGSLSIILRGRRLWADRSYVRQNQWNIPAVIDTGGIILKPINAWNTLTVMLTIWDSTGTLWWWSPVEDVPTGDALKRFLDTLKKSTSPMVSESYRRTVSKSFAAATVGWQKLSSPQAQISRVISLKDDSTNAVGPLYGPVISSNGLWLAAFDFYRYSIRVYQLPSGDQVTELQADSAGSRYSSWLVPDSIYKRLSRFMIATLNYPGWSDTVLKTIMIHSYVKSFSPESKVIDKKYYVVGFSPPEWKICCGAEFKPMTKTFCTGEYCAEGTFHTGGGFVLSQGRFYLPFRRGYLAMGSDSSMVINAYENPLRDTFYTYAPLYGAFDANTGDFLDSTIGALDERVSKRYGLGLSLHEPWHLSCDQQTGICAWVQWLSQTIEMSDGRTIPLRHYWNASMLDSMEMKRRSAVPKAREVSYILDSAGAKVERVVLTPSSVFVLWKVKEYGYPLEDREHGFYVLQEYDRERGRFTGEWQLPAQYNEQSLIGIAYDQAQNQIAGLYQGTWKTTLAYYGLPHLKQSSR